MGTIDAFFRTTAYPTSIGPCKEANTTVCPEECAALLFVHIKALVAIQMGLNGTEIHKVGFTLSHGIIHQADESSVCALNKSDFDLSPHSE